MATVSEQLLEAQSAYHDLVTGRAARVVIDQNGERVEFVSANRTQLYLYIQSLQRQLLSPAPVPMNSPAGFVF